MARAGDELLGSAAPPSRSRARIAIGDAAAADEEGASAFAADARGSAVPPPARRKSAPLARDRRFAARMPAYATMTAPELSVAGAAFGLRPAAREAMVEQLERLWRVHAEALALARARTRHDPPRAPSRPAAPPDPRAGWPRVTAEDELVALAHGWIMADAPLYERMLTFETIDLAHILARLEAAAEGARVRARLSRPAVCAMLDGWGVSYQCRWRAAAGGAC